MPNTYVALKTETVTGSPASSVTFDLTGISGYTDLVVVADFTMSSPSGTTYIVGRVGNGTIDTGSNYSSTVLVGNGSTATSYRTGSVSYFQCDTYITGSNRAMFEVNFQSYANTSVNKTILGRTSSAATNASAIAARWASNSAITTIRFYDFSGNSFAIGSTFSLYGIANADQGAAKATGGIITEDSQYWYHTFGASGTFTPKQSLTCDYLVVAGGAGGGASAANDSGGGGGGGAGGFRTSIGGSPLSLTAINYPITIGAGGAGGTYPSGAGTRGVDSVFSSITSNGGGGGAPYNVNATTGTYGSGGGGGGGINITASNGTAGQGNNGGNGAQFSAGGGGGAGANGTASTNGGGGGNGGIGSASSITGLSVTYAGGGGGGAYNNPAGTGGTGGGGAGGANGVSQNGTAGTVNTGGGGGGGGGGFSTGVRGAGATGGSGIVIIRYPK
jgi:hypothetical protein